MIPEVQNLADARCNRWMEKRYTGDPALSDFAAKVSASVRAFHAGDAAVLAHSIVAELNAAPHLTVIGECPVNLPEQAFQLVAHGQAPTGAHMPYTGDGRRRVIDLVVYDHRTGTIRFYEIKRGTDVLGADQRRQRLFDDAVLRMVGVDYARRVLARPATAADAGVISYYGRSGLPAGDTLMGADLDDAFGWPVQRVVEEHLAYFRQICERAMPGFTAEARA